MAINNNATTDKNVNFSINNYSNIPTLYVYRTSVNEDAKYLGTISPSGNSFAYNLPKESITTFTTMPPGFDFYSPHVTGFTVAPVSTTDSIIANWTVADDTALNRIELWRTSDKTSYPDYGNWTLVTSKDIFGLQASGQFTDTPPTVGTWWYSLHVYDQYNNPTYEPLPGPLKVVKTTG